MNIVEKKQCKGCDGTGMYGGADYDGAIFSDVPCLYCKGTGKVLNKPLPSPTFVERRREFNKLRKGQYDHRT